MGLIRRDMKIGARDGQGSGVVAPERVTLDSGASSPTPADAALSGLAEPKPLGLRGRELLKSISQETLAVGERWSQAEPRVYLIPVRKLSQVALLLGSLAMSATLARQGLEQTETNARSERPSAEAQLLQARTREREASEEISKGLQEARGRVEETSLERARAEAREKALGRKGGWDYSVVALALGLACVAAKGIEALIRKAEREGRAVRGPLAQGKP